LLGLREMQWISREGAFNSNNFTNTSDSSSGLTVAEYFFNSVFFLAFAFIVLTFVSFYRFALMLYYKHNPKSLEIALYVCVGIWAAFRAVFFIFAPLFPDDDAMTFIYGLATNVQVAAYSLLLLYCAQRVHFRRWRKINKKLYWGFVVANVILFVINLVAMLIVTLNDFSSTTPTIVNSSFFLAMFLLIAIVFVIYSIALIMQKDRDPRFKHENPKALIALTITIALCMTIHCIWDAINLIENLSVSIPSKDPILQVTIFFMFFFWELIPACVTTIFFGRISTGDEFVRPQEAQITVTVDSSAAEGTQGTKSSLLEHEEKQRLLPPPRRTLDASSPGSFSGPRHGGTLIPTAATRGTTQLVGNDGSTPNFHFVTQQLAVIAAGDDRQNNGQYRAPSRSSLEFAQNNDDSDKEDADEP